MFRHAPTLIRCTFVAWRKDHVPRLAAAMAFYAAFAVAPLLLVALKLAGSVTGGERAGRGLDASLRQLVGPSAAAALQDLLRQSASTGGGGTWPVLLETIALTYVVLRLFTELQASMNAIWGVAPRANPTWRGFLRDRLLSFVAVLGIGLLLLVTLGVSASVAGAGGQGRLDPWPRRAAGTAGSLLVFAFLVAAVYKTLPDVRVAWADVWVGAAVTALLLLLGEHAVGLYLAHRGFGSIYGVVGSVAVLLIWVYYSAHVLFLGAEFTQVYARRNGYGVKPDEKSVRTKAAGPDGGEDAG